MQDKYFLYIMISFADERIKAMGVTAVWKLVAIYNKMEKYLLEEFCDVSLSEIESGWPCLLCEKEDHLSSSGLKKNRKLVLRCASGAEGGCGTTYTALFTTCVQ